MSLRDGVVLLLAVVLSGTSCVSELDTTRTVPARGSFGAIVYEEACQRVAWTAQLDEKEAGLRQTVDPTNAAYQPVCSQDLPAPEDAPRKLKALQRERGVIVRVVDWVLPADFLAPLQKFLEAMVVLNDDGTLPGTLEAVAGLLDQLAADKEFTDAMGRISGRGGMRPAAIAGGIAGPAIRFGGIDDLLERSLALLLDEDGGPVPELRSFLLALSLEFRNAQPLADAADPERTLRLALRLLTAPAREAAPPGASPLFIARRDARGAPVPAQPIAAPLVDLDGDRLPDLGPHGRFVGSGGRPAAVGTPFPIPGALDPPEAVRDAEGRLLGAAGPFYAYLGLEGSVLSALVREQYVLSNPDADNLLGLVHGGAALLGPRIGRTREWKGVAAPGAPVARLAYSGFDLARAPLLDLAHAWLQLLGAPRARDLLLAVGTLLDVHEAPTARALSALLDVNERSRKPLYAGARIPSTSTLYDDLWPLIARVLRVPGLAGHLLDALTDQHVLGLSPMLARLFVSSDRFVLDQNLQTVRGSFGVAPDRKAPDSDWNRSLMQRLMHLIHDANGVQFCNRQGAAVKVLGLPLLSYDRCRMFRIDDLGLFFALTIVDRAITDDKGRPETRGAASFREQIVDPTMRGLIVDGGAGDSTIQLLTGITGFTRFPTPQAAARSLFLDPAHQSQFMRDASDPVACADGDRFLDAHGDTLFAWEQALPANPSGYAGDTFYDAVKPLLNAFAMHDECVGPGGPLDCSKRRNAVKIFLDLISVLHEHWGSARSQVNGAPFQSADPAGKRYATLDGAVSYEPLLAEVLGATDLVPAIIALAPTLNGMTLDGTPGGERARPVLLDAARYLFDPLVTPVGVAYRDGRTGTVASDGKTQVPRATPYHLLADALASRRAALDAAPSDRSGAWRAATSNLVDELLTVETPPGGAPRLKNRRLHGVMLAAIDFLRERLEAHARKGDLDEWVRKRMTADLTATLDGPIAAGLVDLVARIESDGEALRQLYGLLRALAGEGEGGAFAALVVSVGDLLQLFLDERDVVPIARGAALALDPDRLVPSLRLLQRARSIDPNRPAPGDPARHTTLVTVLRNFFAPPAPGHGQPIADLADALAEIHRAEPGAGSDLTADDYRLMMGHIRGFLIDEKRGLMRFVRIVKNRRLPATP